VSYTGSWEPLVSILSLAAILVGNRDQRTQFWKGAIQESFQQSLVEIGPVVSEEKFFFKFHPPFFLICIISQNWQKFKVHKKILSYMLKSSSLCLYSSNLGTFWLKIEQFWPFEEISIFSNSGHLEWRAGLSDTILKGTHPGTIPARFALIWFSGFRGEDLNVIFYQNMPNLHYRYISTERKISQKNPEYMLNYSLPCSCS
jgi:hypothetical protein